MTQVLSLKYGRIFKRVFSKPEVFSQFVSDVLGITINIDKIYTEYEYPEPVGFVHSKYDLFAEDSTQRLIVEIQHIKEEDFFDRFLYYHIISMIEQVRSYKAYWFERTVYTIVVLTSVPEDRSINFSCAISDFNPIDEWQQRIDVYPHRLLFLVPRNVGVRTPQRIAKWLNFIADSLDGEMDESHYVEPLFHDMLNAICRTTLNPEELAEVIDDTAWEQVKKRMAAEGRAEGQSEGQAQIITAMLARGVSVTQIVALTGFELSQIELLVTKMK